ncbi:MAG: tRNA pseudouridine(38-40) synthase TruA [Alphaproteobacteria bacterium]
MPRYKLTLEYDGGPFVGWQVQANGPSIQAALEDAVFKLSGQRSMVVGAGRTDAGVHALGQVAHVDIDRDFAVKTIRDGLNAHLRPLPVAVLAAEQAAPDFHARFQARERVYRYRIINRQGLLALDRGRAWLVRAPLDVDAMADAARALLGRHDFTTFRATGCQARSPLKTLDELNIARTGDEIVIGARARSFLHHQVRNMVGTLKLVGEGKWSRADVEAALAARDRTRGGPTAPAGGLYLVAVRY